MKLSSTFALLALVCAVAAPLSSAVEVQTVDRIVAVVNRDVITANELAARVVQVKQNLKQQNIPEPPTDVLQRQVLERMVNEQVQIQFATSTGMKVDDAQLDQATAALAKQNKLSLPDFRKALTEQGIAWDQFRREIRTEMILQRLRQREVDNRVVVTDAEVNEYLKLNANKPQMEYRLAHIQISVPENATPDEVQARRAKIVAARQAINSGQDFGTVAAQYSTAKDATEGGQLGWYPAGSLPEQMVNLLAQLQPGQLTDIIRSPAGFELVKLMEVRKQEDHQVVQQTHVRHILIRPTELVSENEAKAKLSQIRDRILQGAKFEDMARAFSEDGSANKGGDLGWINPGETVPEFEQAMNALKPNDLSEVIHTQFGYHLIQVLERRDQDVTEDRERLTVRNELRKRRADEQYENWARQLRDTAYVDIRLKDE
ncbi:peptidyl-prolyl cis-trans isomerase SurA [Silvimonas terrae]|uniref:Chaperone SurA n=1 Tax=Silvimonas terrae TaxID=300266 RepID=A0A840RLE7_9NEIS|nr:peptidylprolyl isomerase [Silvimonas terrae]MBB5193022.1 peptidyl-prolyl cis-trans isomerase SurA [Silvimonas terrae]